MSSDSKQRDPHPHDVQGRLFSYLCALLTGFGRAMPGPVSKAGGALGQFLRSLMFTISPAVPVDLGRLMVSHSIRHLVFSAFIAGLFFSLLLTAGFTLIDGTLQRQRSGAALFQSGQVEHQSVHLRYADLHRTVGLDDGADDSSLERDC